MPRTSSKAPKAPTSTQEPAWSIPSLREPRYSQSLERGLAILSCFTPKRPVLGIADIADELGMSRSTTHRYVITLLALGYLEQGASRKYRLGLRVTDLGMSALNSTGLREHAQPYLEELRQRSSYTVSLAVLDGPEVLYVDQARSFRRGPGQSNIDVRTGSRLPAYCTAMGKLLLANLPESDQRAVLAGQTCHDLLSRMAKGLDEITNVGDAAILCWAAAAARHGELLRGLDRLAELDRADGPVDVLAAAWVVTALVEARVHADVEEHLAAARQRLLRARGSAVYPHTTGGDIPWYRAHVGSFADQVYPIQALARLHASADDPEALATANAVAGVICAGQGEAGQWWWHYDSRTGEVVEGYPVYTVHQHAMAPMALLDLADAGGEDHLEGICRGLRWLAGPPETDEDLVLDQPPVTWRKVARGDQKKVVRGLRAASTRIRPGMSLSALDRVYRPGAIDRECRPYELGWLLLTWLP